MSQGQRGLLAALALVCLLNPLGAWLLSQHFFPGEPAEVTALYRPAGDIQYYSIARALADGNLGESNLYEERGQGLVAFPLATVAPHALALRVFGARGLLLADCLVALACFLLFAALLRAFGVEPRLAAFAAASVVLATDFVQWQLAELVSKSPVRIWGHRFPRPFVSELYMLAALICAVQVARPRHARSLRWWLGLGVSGALLAQGDVHGVVAVGIVTLGILAWHLREPAGRASLLRAVALAGAPSLVLAAPLAIQLAHSDPEVSARFGVFDVDRVSALRWAFEPYVLGLLPALLAGGLTLRVLLRAEAPGATRDKRIALLLLLGLACAGAVALPLTVGLLGQAIQLYHFRDRLVRYVSYTFLVVALYAVEYALARWWSSGAGRRLVGVAGTLAVALAAAAQLAYSAQWAAHSQHARDDFFGAVSDLGSYREAFAELAGELEHARREGATVLGTFDHQVYVYWQAFGGGYGFALDPFVSLASNARVEERLIELSHRIGRNARQFRQTLDEYVHVFFWASAKYQGHRGHTFAPLEEYTAEQRQDIAASSIFSTWNTVVPPAEYDRLVRDFEAWRPSEPAPRLDVVVLTRDELWRGAAPDPAAFRLTFENDVFRVWRRRPEPGR